MIQSGEILWREPAKHKAAHTAQDKILRFSGQKS